MTPAKLDKALEAELSEIKKQGRSKPTERIITGYLPAIEGRGPRYTLLGEKKQFLRMNSNSYLSLSLHPQLIAAADKVTQKYGVGPGAVRFIDGTFSSHVELEKRIAGFVDKPAAKIFNSAYTSNCGLALTLGNPKTHWIGDQLNHNSIIRAMRIAGVPGENKGIYGHNDMDHLRRCLDAVDRDINRVIIIFDGIFSMRGDYAPIDKIMAITREYHETFRDGVITVVDDSHGIGAYGLTGRGTPEFTGSKPDIIIGTFGKSFGVNGGFIAGSELLIETVRQKADTYIYTNPLSVADCAAATKALDICDSDEGIQLLQHLQHRTKQFRKGLEQLGQESIPGPHPVVPLMVRDTARTRSIVHHLYQNGVLVAGLTFPVVPKNNESIRFQINAAHTEDDIAYVLNILAQTL